MASSAPVLPSVHPPLGTVIDNGAYELIEVLGVGGYGVVYRAVDAETPYPKSYAVKCLIHSQAQSQSRRNHHIREIALHQIASGHPGVVTLHKVVQDYEYTYIIMDYAPDHDLFTQILNNRRYLGDDVIIKHIFLQLLDAVEYVHTLGIYHRDLKPENILCFDDGYRIALTDFGLATTDKTSSEFRTGSVYHMSPECQGGEFSPTGIYSPRFNDVWSLGIILLNLATGRNPWKSATSSDPTFQAYLQDPFNFLPSVLPISSEVNDILIRVLAVDWRKRMSLRHLRRAIENVDSFYSDGVIFEGSLARCPWEVGLDFDADESDESSVEKILPRRAASAENLRSRWSDDTEEESEAPFTASTITQGTPWSSITTHQESDRPSWLTETLGLSDNSCSYPYEQMTPSFTHSPTSVAFSDGPATPATPDSTRKLFGTVKRKTMPTSHQVLTVNTALVNNPQYYDASEPGSPETPDEDSLPTSSASSMMHTAVEFVSYPSSFVFASPRDSTLSLQKPESIDLSDIIDSDAKDLASAMPWNCPTLPVMTSTSSAELMFLSRRPSSEEPSPALEGHSGGVHVSRPGGGARDYVHWPDFCEGDGDDGGGGRSVGVSYMHGAGQASRRQPSVHDGCEANQHEPANVIMTPQRRPPHNRRTSEPWLSDLFRFAKQPRRQGSYSSRYQFSTSPTFVASDEGALKPQNAYTSELPPSRVRPDGQDHRRCASPTRYARPWFLPALFFPQGAAS